MRAELSFGRAALAAGTAAGVLALLVVPWALRNEHVMHAPILLRSDAGLELALANYPAAVSPADRKQQFLDRLHAIHPSFNESDYQAVRSEGEVAYSQRLGAQAKRWMKAHPADAARLILRHVRQTLVPQPWEFDIYGAHLSRSLRAAIIDMASLSGLLALVLGVASRRHGWPYLATMIGIWVAVTSPFQPVPRYIYLVYPFLVFCAADLLAQARQAALRGRFTEALRAGEDNLNA